MIVAVAATQMEIAPFLKMAGEPRGRWVTCITGVGPLETGIRLGRCFLNNRKSIKGVLQFGIGGAYIQPAGEAEVPVLATCLAEREVLGDMGIVCGNDIEYFPESLAGPVQIQLESSLLDKARDVMAKQSIQYCSGTFITVNSVSGTASRGEILRNKWHGLCENMEGFAAARLCNEFQIPLVEMRVISNLVEDRNIENWRLHEACEMAGELAAKMVKELT